MPSGTSAKAKVPSAPVVVSSKWLPRLTGAPTTGSPDPAKVTVPVTACDGAASSVIGTSTVPSSVTAAGAGVGGRKPKAEADTV